MLPLIQTGGGSGGGGGVTSFTGDSVVYNNAASTGAVTLSFISQVANRVFAGPSSGGNAAPTFRSLVGADLPNPSSSTLGGIQSFAAQTSKWINAISTSGVPSATQPAVTDLTWDATVATAGIGFFVGGYGPIHVPVAGSNSALANANKLNVMLMYLPFPVTITKVVCFVNAVSASASQFASFGLYNTSGTKVLDSGTFNVSSGQATGVKTNTITGVPLTVGFYYFCWTTNSTDATFGVTAAANTLTSILNANGSREGTGVATTNGALATPIGTITKTSNVIPYVLFEP